MTGSSSSAQGTSTLDRFFHITERGSTVATEVRAGLVTFFAMAYIIILNPLIIGTTEDHTGHALVSHRLRRQRHWQQA